MKMRRHILVMIIAAVSLCFPARVNAEPLGKRILLYNGMVLLLAEKHGLPIVTVSVTIKAGKTAEPENNPGLASLTASLLMQGTSIRSANQISEEIDFIGGSLSTSCGDDFATASMRVLKKDLRTGLDLLSDILANPVFDQTEIDRQVKITLADIKRRNGEPGIVAKEAFDKTVFGRNPYGMTSEDVANYLPRLTREQILSFYSTRYMPNNSIISVVGDVTEKEIMVLLNSSFKVWRKTDQSIPISVPPPAAIRKAVLKINRDITQANIAMGNLGMSRENPDYYAAMVMNYIFGSGGFSSRLVDNIRDNKGLAYDVHSVLSAQKEPGAFTIIIQTKNESANEVIEDTLKEIHRIQSELVSEKELADAKAYLTGSFPLRMDTYAKIAVMLTAIEIYNLGLDYPQKYQLLTGAVTREDVLRVAQTYLHPGKIIIVVVANLKKAKLKF